MIFISENSLSSHYIVAYTIICVLMCFANIISFCIYFTHMFACSTLQPAVEAFFLVHSSSSTSRDRHLSTNSENREVVPELAPVSPIYSDNEGASQTEATNNTSWDITPAPQKTLPPDQLKFLKFAGMYFNSRFISIVTTIGYFTHVCCFNIYNNVPHFQRRTELY